MFIVFGWRIFGKESGGRTGGGRLDVNGYSSGLKGNCFRLRD